MLEHMLLRVALIAGASIPAAPCADATGKPIKCAPRPTGAECKDKKEKSAKCTVPGAKPIARTTIVKSKSNMMNN